MLIHKEGNLFDSTADILCHQCNCQGKMNSGIAKEVRTRYPNVFESYFNDYENGDLRLGYVNFTEVENKDGKKQVIASMCAQDKYGYDGGQYTDYIAFQKCLDNIMMYAYAYDKNPVIAFPNQIGCVRGGGNWKVIKEMIAANLKDFDVEIWRLDNG